MHIVSGAVARGGELPAYGTSGLKSSALSLPARGTLLCVADLAGFGGGHAFFVAISAAFRGFPCRNCGTEKELERQIIRDWAGRC
jgi:hypothetical protein